MEVQINAFVGGGWRLAAGLAEVRRTFAEAEGGAGELTLAYQHARLNQATRVRLEPVAGRDRVALALEAARRL